MVLRPTDITLWTQRSDQFEQDGRDDVLRFSAFYYYAMHLWNANRLSDHKQLLQDILHSFDDTRFLLIRHSAILAFLAIGANIAIKVEDPVAVGLVFPLMGGVIVTIFGTFWMLWQSAPLDKQRSDNEMQRPATNLALAERLLYMSIEKLAIIGGVVMIALSLGLLWLQYG